MNFLIAYWVVGFAVAACFLSASWYMFFMDKLGTNSYHEMWSPRERLAGLNLLSLVAGAAWPLSIFIGPTYLLAARNKEKVKR